MNYHLKMLCDKLIVSSTSYINPLESLHNIAKDIMKAQYSGEVVFDLLCANGESSNRFISIIFNGESFEYNTVKQIDNPCASLVLEQNKFYRLNKEFIKCSVLPKSDRKQYITV